jgi:hypothetical protein
VTPNTVSDSIHRRRAFHVPLAKPSAAPLTPSAAVTLETKAARAETMIEDLIVEVVECSEKNG